MSRDEPRQLTAQEKQRAQRLMERYVWLAQDIADRCKLLPPDDALSVANFALCKTAEAYVKLGYELPRQEEKDYLARSIINAIKREAREERRRRFVPDEVQSEVHRVVSFDSYMDDFPQRDQMMADFLNEPEAYDYVPFLDNCRAFAKTLPANERAAFEEKLLDMENRQGRTFEEIAKALGISTRNLYDLRRSIGKKWQAWFIDEYAA